MFARGKEVARTPERDGMARLSNNPAAECKLTVCVNSSCDSKSIGRCKHEFAGLSLVPQELSSQFGR